MSDSLRCLAAAAVVLLLGACTIAPPPDPNGPSYVPLPDSTRVAQPFEASGDVRVLAQNGGSYETTVAVSPHDARNAVVGVMHRARRATDVYVTHDGGATWSSGMRLPTIAANGRAYSSGQGDPVVVADRLGVFHFASLMSNAANTTVSALRSTDGGVTWSAPVVVAELPLSASPRLFDDKEWIAVDDTGGPYDGHVYLLWQRIRLGSTPLESRILFARSTDRGVTWSEPVELTTPAPSGQSLLTIGPNGEVYAAYHRDGGHNLRTSLDGGATFGEPTRIATLPWIGGPIPNTRQADFKAFPTLLCDRSSGPHRGNLYVVISTGSTSMSGARVGAVAVSRSTDGGRTWAEPRMISTPTTGDAIFPSGAVDQTNGDLVIAWLDRRDDPANTLARVYATRSRDGGATFEPLRAFTPPFSIDADWIGDYYGVSGHAGRWIATFSPESGQMSAVTLRFEEPETGPRRRAVRKQAEGSRRRAVDHPSTRPALTTPWLQTAIETAAWLESTARERNGGLAWSNDAASPDAVLPGLPGTSGAGFFFLRLYQVTRDARYLAIAERAATYVASTCANPLTLFDWQGGTVGCGELLVALHRETHDALQLERAEAMGASLLSRAKRDGDGLYWELAGTTNLYTGIAHGAGGAIILMLDLYELTGKAQYLDAAESAWRWISRHHVDLGNGAIGWKRLTTDTVGYNGWCGGAAGMIFVFDRLYAVTGKAEYRDQLIATANGLLTTAVATPRGYRWTYGTDGEGGSPLIYCHGSACSIGSLARAYDVIGDPRFLTMATAGASHVESRAQTVGDGLGWRHVETSPVLQNGFMVGGASVGHGFLRLYRTTRDRQYLTLAESAARALLTQAEHPSPGQTRWRVYVEPAPAAVEQTVKVAWWDGTAGIGLFLLELHQFAIGVDPPAHFSPANP